MAPEAVWDWTGLLSLCGLHSLWLELALSAVTVVWAAWVWKDLELGFTAAILAAMLVSRHFNVQDLSLSIVPIYLSAKAGVLPRRYFPALGFLVVSLSMMLSAIKAPLAIPVIAALCRVGWDALSRPRSSRAALHDLQPAVE